MPPNAEMMNWLTGDSAILLHKPGETQQREREQEDDVLNPLGKIKANVVLHRLDGRVCLAQPRSASSSGWSLAGAGGGFKPVSDPLTS